MSGQFNPILDNKTLSNNLENNPDLVIPQKLLSVSSTGMPQCLHLPDPCMELCFLYFAT